MYASVNKSSLVQIMACRLAGPKPLSVPMLGKCCVDPQEQTSMNLNRNSYIFIQENAFENVVWEMVAILSRPQCVKSLATLSSFNESYITYNISASLGGEGAIGYPPETHIS